MSDFAFAGKVFEIRLDNGVVFHNTYGPEGDKLRYEMIDGAAEGGSGTVDLYVGEVSDGVYLVGWNEVSGAAVAHVMDFNTKRLTAFWSFDEGGGRSAEVRTGTFQERDLSGGGLMEQ